MFGLYFIMNVCFCHICLCMKLQFSDFSSVAAYLMAGVGRADKIGSERILAYMGINMQGRGNYI